MKSAEGTSCLNSRYEQLSPLGVNLFFHRSLCLRSQGDWAFESTANSTTLGKLVQLNEMGLDSADFSEVIQASLFR